MIVAHMCEANNFCLERDNSAARPLSVRIVPGNVEAGVIRADAIVNNIGFDMHEVFGPRISVTKICEPQSAKFVAAVCRKW